LSEGPLLRVLGRSGSRSTAGEVWAGLRAELMPEPGEFRPAIEAIEAHGSLATRITRRLAAGAGLRDVYGELADCLAAGRPLI
jgi:hypothetical protein